MNESVEELKKLMLEMNDKKEKVSVVEFRQKFCNECYWSKWYGCDIATVTFEYCCNSLVDFGKYNLI